MKILINMITTYIFKNIKYKIAIFNHKEVINICKLKKHKTLNTKIKNQF